MFKPKCYQEFNPKDFNKKGKKGCWGDYDYTSLANSETMKLEAKCKNCKWRKVESVE